MILASGLLFHLSFQLFMALMSINPFKPEFTIAIIIHYKPRVAGAIVDL